MSNDKPINHLAMEKKQLQQRVEQAAEHQEKRATVTALQQQRKLGETAERASAFMLIGQSKAFHAMSKVTETVTVDTWAKIKESKIYQSLGDVPIDGKVVTVTTWRDFCQHVIGLSREHVDAQIRQLKTLGQEAYEALTNMGLGNRERRQLLKAPEDVKEAIQRAAADNDKEALLEIIEGLSAKHAREKEALQLEAETLKKDLKTNQALLEQKQQRINEQDRQLAEREAVTEDQRATELGKRLETATLEAIGGMAAPANICAEILGWDGAPGHLRHKAETTMARLRAALDGYAEDVGLPLYVIPEPTGFWGEKIAKVGPAAEGVLSDEPPEIPGIEWEDPE